MSFIPCTEKCHYQAEGVCSLGIVAMASMSTGTGGDCLYYVKPEKSIEKQRPLD